MPTAARVVRVLRDAPYRAVRKHYEREAAEAAEEARIPTREDDLCLAPVRRVASVGLKRFRAFEEALENGFGSEWTRSRAQREFHEICSAVLAETILGEDWERDGPDLCENRGWRVDLYRLVLCKMPRRFGKSMATAMVVAALVDCFVKFPPRKDVVISCFSTGKRASSGLADYVRQLLAAAGLDALAYKSNSENVFVRAGDSGASIKISFYPSNRTMSSISPPPFFLFLFSFPPFERGRGEGPSLGSGERRSRLSLPTSPAPSEKKSDQTLGARGGAEMRKGDRGRQECPICGNEVKEEHDVTVLKCCADRAFHAACVHRPFVSSPLECPKCGSSPSLPYFSPDGAMPSRTPASDDRGARPREKGWLASALERLIASPENASVDDLLCRHGWTPANLARRGIPPESLPELGLTRAVATKHADAFADAYGRGAVERALDARKR